MDFLCSLTGKSPSTTGAGSEGALTKGPFNALRTIADLNNALVSFVLTGYAGFSSSAGYVGPDVRVDHDISLLVPEIWARIEPQQREPAWLIQNGCLEKLDDFDHDGERVLASRLGYRITSRFVHGFFGKIFDNPCAVFADEILKPETQSLDIFVDGIHNIVEAQQREAQRYIDDGSIEDACPPLRALINIMATGEHDGMDAQHPAFRAMFTRKHLIKSRWYKQRLEVKQYRDIALWQRNVNYLKQFLDDSDYTDEAERLDIAGRYQRATDRLKQVQSRSYLKTLVGTLGADPLGLATVAAGNQLINWNRMKLSFSSSGAVEHSGQGESAEAKPTTLLQRFKARFRRTHLQ